MHHVVLNLRYFDKFVWHLNDHKLSEQFRSYFILGRFCHLCCWKNHFHSFWCQWQAWVPCFLGWVHPTMWHLFPYDYKFISIWLFMCSTENTTLSIQKWLNAFIKSTVLDLSQVRKLCSIKIQTYSWTHDNLINNNHWNLTIFFHMITRTWMKCCFIGKFPGSFCILNC